MEQIKLARLAVAAAPYLIDKPYTYTVPDALEPVLERGMRVLVVSSTTTVRDSSSIS